MSKKKKSSKKKSGKKSNSFFSDWSKNLESRKPILQFSFGLFFLMMVYFMISFSEIYEDFVNIPIVKGYANLGNFFLQLFGFDTTVDGTQILGTYFDMNIGKGCDAVTPTIMFLIAILIYPTKFEYKWRWLLIAPFAFALLNLVRIISLYLIGVYAPSFFDFAHIEFWQGVFIVVVIAAWLYWLMSVLSKK